jgi:hypothetical protein
MARVRSRTSCETGSSLAELVISLGVTSVVAGIMVSGMLRLSDTHGAIANRTELHAGVRGAIELLQHEVSQAGRIQLPGSVTLPAAVVTTGSQTVGISSAADMFVGEWLDIDTGPTQETVSLTGVNVANNQITANFSSTHAASVPVTVQGGFAGGIVPTTTANGSTATVLKIFGDINDDGRLMYVEYTCDTVAGNLYRNVVSFTAASKPVAGGAHVLLSNIRPNPGGTACFVYQQKTVGPTTFVVDVAVTLTLQTQFIDPSTKDYQTETKALLNVSPRNVFDTWKLASIGVINRIQPTPASVLGLLP